MWSAYSCWRYCRTPCPQRHSPSTTHLVLNSMQRFAEAEKYLVDALRYDGQIKNDVHIFSFSLYELAMVHISRDEFARERILLNMAKDNYSDYESKARLNFKVHSTLSSLN